MDWINYLFLIAAGAVGGFLSGLLGIGGALVFIPILTQFISKGNVGVEEVPYILANSFIIVFVAGASASYKQYKMNNLFPKSAILVAIPAAIVSIGIGYVINLYTNDGNNAIKNVFKIFFLIILIFIVIQTLMKSKKNDFETMPSQIKPIKYIGSGIGVGFLSGITGLGGGAIMLPIFHNLFKLKYTVSTSLSSSVIPMFTLPLLLYYAYLTPQKDIYVGMQTGYICWPLILPLIPFIVIFSQMGVKYSHKFPIWVLKTIFAVIILINIYKIVFL